MPVDGNLPDLPEVAGDFQADRRDREACWADFVSAAQGYSQGDGGRAARAYLARVEGKFGDEVAARQRRELWNWVKANEKKRKG